MIMIKFLSTTYPSPAAVAGNTIHLHQTEGENTTKGAGHASDDIEEGIPLSDFVSAVPGTKQIDDAREET